MTEFPPRNHKEYLQRNLFTLPYSPASTADTITLKHCRVDRGTLSCAQLLGQTSKKLVGSFSWIFSSWLEADHVSVSCISSCPCTPGWQVGLCLCIVSLALLFFSKPQDYMTLSSLHYFSNIHVFKHIPSVALGFAYPHLHCKLTQLSS